MSVSVLITYATSYGSTPQVAEAIATTLRTSGLVVDLQPVRQVRSLAEYRAVVLGAPLLMFHWHKDALRFLSQHHEALAQRPVAIFALGPTHVPHDEKEWQDSRAQLDNELGKFPWLKPVALKLFGGKYDPTKLGFPINLFAGKAPATDIRDWDAIRTWATDIKPLLMAERTKA